MAEAHDDVGRIRWHVGSHLLDQLTHAPRAKGPRRPRDDVEDDEPDLEGLLVDGRYRGDGGAEILLPVRLGAVDLIGRRPHGHRADAGRLGMSDIGGGEADGGQRGEACHRQLPSCRGPAAGKARSPAVEDPPEGVHRLPPDLVGRLDWHPEMSRTARSRAARSKHQGCQRRTPAVTSTCRARRAASETPCPMTRGSGRDTTRSWRSCPYWRNALVFGSSLRLGLGVVLDPVIC
jgi:hypothetical protein